MGVESIASIKTVEGSATPRTHGIEFGMTKVFFCGDPHGVFSHIIRAWDEHQPAAVVLLGDLECRRPLDVELAPILDKTRIYWIPGNHDTDSADNYDNLFESALKGNNIEDRIIGVAGITIGGIGGVFREKIWNGVTESNLSPKNYLKTCGAGSKWRGGLPLRHRSSIFPTDIAAFKGMSVDVLVTHEAPNDHAYGNVALTNLAQNLKVKRAFHGHHHQLIKYPNSPWTGVSLRGIVSMDTETFDVVVIDPGLHFKKN
jgi:predicted phosphodiesterase